MRIEIDKEEYKDLIETKEEFLKTVRKLDNITIENIKLTDKLQEKEQECEELKREIAFGNNGELSDKIRAIVFKDLNAENSKYKQALDEIEYYINNQGINNKWNMRIQRFRMGILDIINKTKDSK